MVTVPVTIAIITSLVEAGLLCMLVSQEQPKAFLPGILFMLQPLHSGMIT